MRCTQGLPQPADIGDPALNVCRRRESISRGTGLLSRGLAIELCSTARNNIDQDWKIVATGRRHRVLWKTPPSNRVILYCILHLLSEMLLLCCAANTVALRGVYIAIPLSATEMQPPLGRSTMIPARASSSPVCNGNGNTFRMYINASGQ